MNRSSSRRNFLSLAGAAPLALAAQTSVQPRRPNIVILLADDQRFDTIHALNNPSIRTPNLDSLVKDGTSFRRAFIMGGNSPAVCAPSRAMLLTGRTLFHLPNTLTAPWTVSEPDAGKNPYPMFPEIFRKAGYRTFLSGKWHNGERSLAPQFDAAENIFFGGMSDHNKVPVANFDPTGAYPKASRRIESKFSAELFTDSAIRFIQDQKGDQPFLLYLPYTTPHDPRTPPKEYLDMYPPEKMDVPPNFLPEHPFDNGELKVRDEMLAPWPRTQATIREHLSAYYGMITHTDAQIGRILKALGDAGKADDTIVIFAADNGLAVGQHGLLGKQNLYDHSVRVPLMMRGPGIPRGQRTDAMCYLLDIFPTLCELAGVQKPETVEGKSLVPILKRPRSAHRDSVFFAYRDFQRGIRTSDWKLILYNANGKQERQLFDLRNDPWEMKNLAHDPSQTPRLAGLTVQLQQKMRQAGDPLDLGKPNWGIPTAT